MTSSILINFFMYVVAKLTEMSQILIFYIDTVLASPTVQMISNVEKFQHLHLDLVYNEFFLQIIKYVLPQFTCECKFANFSGIA